MSFHTLLIANRGEIARRVMRSARAMGLRCAAVYVDADADAPFVAEADEALRLQNGYLDGKAVLDAARACGAGAIHPGYGFLSENADFARAVGEAGLTFVGPSPEAIARMGDKIAAKALAEEVGVPVLAGATDEKDAERVGFPLLVKAAAGGGGKGMRIVEEKGALAEALASARREAESGFGDDRVFLERYVSRARHIEVQILGDAHGNLVHLGERECSIQRRHQKILEEAPSPRVDAALRARIGDAALALARALHYQSAGTVEFLLDDETGEFFFLEVNTRLQVEHAVTEAVTGIDLVHEQLRIAAGEALGYAQGDIEVRGAAIEARLYAENPARNFLPATGTLALFEPAQEPSVRWDTGVHSGTVVGADFDPMLAKVIAAADTRALAAARLASALSRSAIAGVITNQGFLVAVLRTPEFLAGDTTTDFIQRVKPVHAPGAEALRQSARAAALFIQGENRARARVQRAMPSGWRNARMPAERVLLQCGDEEIRVNYRRRRDGRFDLFEAGEAGSTASARVHAWRPDAIDVEIEGRRFTARIARQGDKLFVHGPYGGFDFVEKARFQPPGETEESDGSFVARMPGKVIELRVQAGDRVEAGDTLLVLEAMKMEHPVSAPAAGVVRELRVALGDQVETGTLLLVVEADGADAAQ